MSPLKTALKRGALLAAANWQVALIQSIADSLFKLLIAVPVVGGVFLVVLVIGAEPQGILALEWREILTTILAALMSQPAVLTAFLLALAVVVLGGSLFLFLVKAGTVATLVAADRRAPGIEQPPLHLSTMARAGAFAVDDFIASSARLFPRYAGLGMLLLALYVISAVGFVAAATLTARTVGLGAAATLTAPFVAWITFVNLLYVLAQVVIAADDCGPTAAIRRVAVFLRADVRGVAAVFGVVLAVVVLGTGVSIVAMAALSLIGFVPFFGLAVVPLQLAAWLCRAVVFQYIDLTAVGAYLHRYRGTPDRRSRVDVAVGPPSGDAAWTRLAGSGS
ncbi:MAG: hypothetical protein FJW23_01270 [Acidimicrobiia bacterium]|nr:hypothetical protein [Acidimicrobiia bacterium]